MNDAVVSSSFIHPRAARFHFFRSVRASASSSRQPEGKDHSKNLPLDAPVAPSPHRAAAPARDDCAKMATRVVVPATTFALGAASQRQFGYVDVALDYARRSDPSVASYVDAMFGRASDSARTVADAVTRAPSASASDGVAAAWTRARETATKALGGTTTPTTLGGARATTERAARTTSARSTTMMPKIGLRGYFIAGAVTGCAVAYALGPERCKRAARRCVDKCEDAMKRAMAIVADAFERVFSDDVRAAMEDAISRCRDAIGGVGPKLAPMLKSSTENLHALLETSVERTTACTGKMTAFVGDFSEKYVAVAASAIKARAIDGYAVARVGFRDVVDKSFVGFDAARRRAREFLATVVDAIKPSKSR